MLKDQDGKIRAKAVRYIRDARNRDSKRKTDKIRPFQKPKIDMETSSYDAFMLKLRPREIFEPPLTKSWSEVDLDGQILDVNHMDFIDSPSNSQCVERWIKRVTESSRQKIGYFKRHQMLCNQQASIEKIPVWASKKDMESALPNEPLRKRPSRSHGDKEPPKRKKE